MSQFRDVKTLQKFASIHASIHNHFKLERHSTPRETFKQNRAAAMAGWRQLAACNSHNFDIRRLVRIRLTAPVGHINLATYQASIIVRFLLSRGAGGRIEDITPVSHRLVSDGSMVSSIAKLVERDSALPSS